MPIWIIHILQCCLIEGIAVGNVFIVFRVVTTRIALFLVSSCLYLVPVVLIFCRLIVIILAPLLVVACGEVGLLLSQVLQQLPCPRNPMTYHRPCEDQSCTPESRSNRPRQQRALPKIEINKMILLVHVSRNKPPQQFFGWPAWHSRMQVSSKSWYWPCLYRQANYVA